ncbi:LINE-1 reverse transcriptase isogeny [Gossypium australe]|uniref:LINE-1 reverse transcriptase isogeny n=1 Tax=Gossypium australe TaxID=47621 RepID=A0A5B6X0X3_9ROSI|nr:LINE-1 reverse transcriptase isogeny [Gossypium australe]
MAPLKALGSDGFHALFFQKHWDILGEVVCDWVRKVFEGNPIDPELNNTLVVLIPKVQNPDTFGQFRPISLCSVLYKLTVKVIANWFKYIFPKIIVHEQAGFITGRSITDNIILAQEVIHTMRSQKNKKWMAIKIDLEKAYDRVSWEFIEASLRAAGIPNYINNVITSSTSNSAMQVMWNGVPLSKFRPIRGVRQGCPLFPYIFVLCMEWLGHLIKSAISKDNLVIFSKADIGHCGVLKTILDDFCAMSGHKINVRKTKIFFSKGVDDNMVNSISIIFEFQRVHNLGHYLGVPLFHQNVTSSTL